MYVRRVLFRDVVVVLFFFSSRRRHTRYWRDWSSDVCSSDLDAAGNVDATPASDSFTVNTVVTSNSPFPGIRYYSTMGVYEGASKGFVSEPSLLQDQYNTYVGSASENAYLDLDNDATRYYFCGGRDRKSTRLNSSHANISYA